MLKKIILSSAVSAMLLLSGCGGDSAGEDRLKAQHAIDSGDSTTAINILEAKDQSSLTDADKMTLASAYMQDAGVSLMDVVSKLDTQDGTESSFASVADDILGNSTSVQVAKKVKSIDKAITYYESMSVTPYASAPYKAVNVTEVLDGIKLYLGMAYFSKVTMLLSFFGDVSALEDDSVSIYKDSYKATEEALKCIYDSDCSSVTSTYIGTDTLNNTNPTVFVIDVNGNSFYRWATEGTSTTTTGKMIIADYKTVDDIYTYSTQSSGKYILSSDDMPFGSSYLFDKEVLEALNGAYQLVLDKAPDDVKEDMEEKFKDIDTDLSHDISMSEIRAYMSNNN